LYFKKITTVLAADASAILYLISLGLIAAAAEILNMAVVYWVFSAIGNTQDITSLPIYGEFWGLTKFLLPDLSIHFLITCMFLIIFSAGSRGFVVKYTNNRVAKIRTNLIIRVYKHYIEQPYEFYFTQDSSELTKNTLSEIDLFISNYFVPITQIIINSIILISLSVYIFFLNVYISIIAITLFSTFYTCIYLRNSNKLKQYGQTKLRANLHRFQTVSESFAGIKLVKLLNVSDNYIQRLILPVESFSQISAKIQTISQVPRFLIEGLILLGLTALLFGFLSLSETNKYTDLVPLIGTMGFAAMKMLPAVQSIFHSASSIRSTTPILGLLHQILSKEVANSNISAQLYQSKPILFEETIQLKDISFSYDHSHSVVLNKVSLEIKRGKNYAFFGKSGSGKTTLVDIMIGLLIPRQGYLIVDGKTLQQHNLTDWKNIVGYAPQEAFVVNGSVLENIGFGSDIKNIDLEFAKKCLSIAELNNLPDGRSIIEIPDARALSGGQKQRLSIARALYRNPKLLILDEATSGLDANTERKVFKNIAKFLPRLTTVLITHNTSLLLDNTNIFFVNDGTIYDYGTYDKLIESCEEFQNLVRSNKNQK